MDALIWRANRRRLARPDQSIYEYYHQYYVEEGNKRVSVMKFLGGNSIMADVTRILPKKKRPKKPSVLRVSRFYSRTPSWFYRLAKKEEYSQLESSCRLAKRSGWTEKKSARSKQNMNCSKSVCSDQRRRDAFERWRSVSLVFRNIWTRGLYWKSRLELEKELLRIQADLRAFPKN